MSTPEPLIEIAGIAKAYEGRSALRDAAMTLMPGEMIGLVGANGGGKTTTLRILAGLLRPDFGRGTVLGEDIYCPSRRRRQRLGYMSQRLAFYPDLSVRENLRFHCALHGLADPALHIARIARQYDLEPILGECFGNLSGGWARRVQFAATNLHAPPLLLLDEPTAGLDMLASRSIWNWLAELVRNGRGIVVSTHDISEAARCSKIVFYNGGQAHAPISPHLLREKMGTASLESAIEALIETESA